MRKQNRFKEINGIKYKSCTKCKEFKVLETEFTLCKTTDDKRTPSCKECRRKIPQDNDKKRKDYKEKGREKKATYYQENKQDIHEKRKELARTNNEVNLIRRVRRFVRKGRIHCNDKYPQRTKEILGCSKKELFEYLKVGFKETYGIEYKDEYFKDLHIDHKIPISLGKTEEELIKLNHYTNLQFLYKDHNMEKKTKTEYKIPNFPIENY
jgi:hypothetical protein